jgi:hypothetical protein
MTTDRLKPIRGAALERSQRTMRQRLLTGYLGLAKHYRDDAKNFPPMAQRHARVLMRLAALGWRRQMEAL